MPGPLGQLLRHLTGIQEVAGLIIGHATYVYHENSSMTIVSLPLVQVGHLAFAGKSMGT